VFSSFEKKNSNLKLELEGFRVYGYNFVPKILPLALAQPKNDDKQFWK